METRLWSKLLEQGDDLLEALLGEFKQKQDVRLHNWLQAQIVVGLKSISFGSVQ